MVLLRQRIADADVELALQCSLHGQLVCRLQRALGGVVCAGQLIDCDTAHLVSLSVRSEAGGLQVQMVLSLLLNEGDSLLVERFTYSHLVDNVINFERRAALPPPVSKTFDS